MKRKTGIQFAEFAHLGKQIACFIRLFAGATYDLNCNCLFASLHHSPTYKK